MKANSNEYPSEIQELGDGTYFKNTNITEREDTNEDGTIRISYDYDQEHFFFATAPLIPVEVAAWRLRAITDIDNLTKTIFDFLSSIPGDDGIIAREAWYSGTTIRRDSVTVSAFASVLGKTEQEMDEYFIRAADIQI